MPPILLRCPYAVPRTNIRYAPTRFSFVWPLAPLPSWSPPPSLSLPPSFPYFPPSFPPHLWTTHLALFYTSPALTYAVPTACPVLSYALSGTDLRQNPRHVRYSPTACPVLSYDTSDTLLRHVRY
eukprot:1556569-Rhodomonas_salina.1